MDFDRVELALVEASSQGPDSVQAQLRAKHHAAAVGLDRFATIMRRSLLTTRRLELQFRAWAAVDAHVRAALDQVDANRLAYFERLFQAAGRSHEDAEALARIAYWTYLGRMQAPMPDAASVEQVVERLVRLARSGR